jgi:hypothetical protein
VVSIRKTIYLILLLYAYSISAVNAGDKITGAFGINLGDTFDPESAIGQASLTDGTPMYQFKPAKTFRSFSKYYALITPNTNKVYAIWGIGQMENDPTCKKEQKLIMAILQNKYGKQEKKDLFSSLNDAEMISQGDRYIMTKCSGFTDVTIDIRYKDKELEELAENERIHLESEKLDSSGL